MENTALHPETKMLVKKLAKKLSADPTNRCLSAQISADTVSQRHDNVGLVLGA